MKMLVTGAAGFIGFFLAKQLCAAGHEVVGIDNLNDYYAVSLKKARLQQLEVFSNFSFQHIDIADHKALAQVFHEHCFDRVLHMAAQAGVRYSLEHPEVYVQSNLVGFSNLLECCRQHRIVHLLAASSSSVYGLNAKLPFAETDNTDRPISFYGATKKANEVLANSYSHLYQLPITMLRFFTVYGPWGRPDMAPYKFVDAVLQGKEIEVYNHGKQSRDFTYIDDVVEAVLQLLDKIPAQCEIFNVGNSSPVQLMDFIEAVENAAGKKAKLKMAPMQAGDVLQTFADVGKIKQATDWEPKTTVTEGMKYVVEWYKKYKEI